LVLVDMPVGVGDTMGVEICVVVVMMVVMFVVVRHRNSSGRRFSYHT
jgi:hypothetical protein